jgi:hypothetical protein
MFISPSPLAPSLLVVADASHAQAMKQWDRMEAGYVGCLKNGAVWTEPGAQAAATCRRCLRAAVQAVDRF